MKTGLEIANSAISNERKQKFELNFREAVKYDEILKHNERTKAKMFFDLCASRFSKAPSTDHYAILEKAMYDYQQVAYGQMTLEDAYYKASEAL